MKKTLLVICGLLLVLVVGLYISRKGRMAPPSQNVQTTPAAQPHSYAECVAAGNMVLESRPRQCSSGKYTFTEPQDAAPHEGEAVALTNIRAHDLVKSPLALSGRAPGNWFFEANIGVRLLDANGVEVARGHAMATTDWMKLGAVPFSGTIAFQAPKTDTGYIEIEKDNPSDNPGTAESVRVPVRFK